MLNLKDPEAHWLAKALARETGETMTRAVIESMRERLDRLTQRRSAASAEELLAIGRRCAAVRTGELTDHAALLYDERGLPT